MRDLRKTLYLATGLGVKLVTGLVAVKMCAQYLGPEQFGLTGQLSSLIAIVSLLAGAGVNVGLAKVYADTTFPPNDRANWVSAAGWLVLATGLILGTGFLLSADIIKTQIFPDLNAANWILISLVLSIFPIGFSAVNQGKISGSHRDDLYALSMILGSLLGLAGIWLLGKFFASTGALIAMIWLITSHSLALIFLGRVIDRIPFDFVSDSRLILPKIRFLVGYGVLSIASGVVIPVAYILIRLFIQEYNDSVFFGLWQATLRISEAYGQLPLMLLSVVFFARFAASSNKPLEVRDVLRTYLSVSFVALSISAVVYFTRRLWIPLVFTVDFLPMERFLIWQLIGDLLRIISYVGTTILAARGAIKVCIFGEFFQGGMLLLLGFVFIPMLPEYGVYVALISTYFIYGILSFIFLVRFNALFK